MERGQVIILRGELSEWSAADFSGSGSGSGYYKQIAAAIVSENPRPNSPVVAFWKSDANGFPLNGGSSKIPASIGMTEEIHGPLKICYYGFHATMNPEEWKGERLWVVALYGEVQQQGNKWAALKREILGEIPL